MEHYKARQTPQDLGDRFASARELTPTKAPGPSAPRCSYKHAAPAGLVPVAPALPPYVHVREPSLAPFTTAPPFVPHAASHPTGDGVFVAPDGALVRSDADFEAGSVPGNYRNRTDYNMVQRTPGSGMRVVAQQYPVQTVPPRQTVPIPLPSNPTGPAPAFALVVPPYDSMANPTPVTAATPQLQTVIPSPRISLRLVLLGPLRMIRSQCVAKIDLLRPILVWLDQHMGEELRAPALSDTMLSNVVYAVNIPMGDEHWRDWNKVLTVFPRAAAWQRALTPEEPFDQVTSDHPTVPLFVEGEPLQALLDDMVEQYNLGMTHDVEKSWDAPGQTERLAPLAREANARR